MRHDPRRISVHPQNGNRPRREGEIGAGQARMLERTETAVTVRLKPPEIPRAGWKTLERQCMWVMLVRVNQEDAGPLVVIHGGGDENTHPRPSIGTAKPVAQAKRQRVGAKVAVHQGVYLGSGAWEAGSVVEGLLPTAAERILGGQEQRVGSSRLGVLP